MSWYSSLFFTFNHLTERRQNLLLAWNKITYEAPVKSDADYEVSGLPAEENKRFWAKEAKLNAGYQKISTIFLLNTCILFSIQHYYSHRLETDRFINCLVLGLHIVHYCIYCFIFLHAVYSPVLFFVTLLIFFAKKFRHIADQVERSLNKGTNNRNLRKWVFEFHDTIYEMIQMNDLFKGYMGFNLLHCFLFITLVTFVSIFVNTTLKIAIYMVLLNMYTIVQVLPFHLANAVTSQVNLHFRLQTYKASLRGLT